MSHAAQIRRRDRMFREHPYCHWCGTKVVMVTGSRVKSFPDNAATLDHRHGRLDPRRRVDSGPSNRTVLSCWRCNQIRCVEDQQRIGIDELRRRASHQPREAGP